MARQTLISGHSFLCLGQTWFSGNKLQIKRSIGWSHSNGSLCVVKLLPISILWVRNVNLGNFNCRKGSVLVRVHMELFWVFKFPVCGTTCKLGQNSAKFSKILKKSKGQTKYLRPSHFWKRPNCHNLPNLVQSISGRWNRRNRGARIPNEFSTTRLALEWINRRFFVHWEAVSWIGAQHVVFAEMHLHQHKCGEDLGLLFVWWILLAKVTLPGLENDEK